MSKSKTKKIEKFKKLHPEGRKEFAHAKRVLRLKKRWEKIKKRQEKRQAKHATRNRRHHSQLVERTG